MPKKIDLTGRRFGRLVVLHDTSERKSGNGVWRCRCDCGNKVNVVGCSLTSGYTTSCGCYNRECVAEANTTHGMTQHGEWHPVYRAWFNMLQRCENPNNKRYKDYGGRGIAVCDEWHSAERFIGWALASGWEKGLSIDRIDNNGNYEPDNCRWVTRKVQSRNKRSNHLVAFNGRTQCLTNWAEETKILRSTLYTRINILHWPIERALTESARGHTNAS